MYFESRVHVLRSVANAAEAAHLIGAGQSQWYEVLTWEKEGVQFLCVADGYLDDMFQEVAILRKEPDGSLLQVESITAGWINSAQNLEMYFTEAESASPFATVQLPLFPLKGDEYASFTCGCCGETFTSNIKRQLEFDQDAGYGLCDHCS